MLKTSASAAAGGKRSAPDSAALKMITDMERIGDQTSDIAEIIILLECQKREIFR